MTDAHPDYRGLRARLRNAEPTTAAFLDLGNPVSAEITADSGFDVVIVDLEHGSGGEATARTQILAIERLAQPVVRTPDGPTQIARMLDAGATGVVVPQIAGAAAAAEAAAAVRYAGTRGVSALSRSAKYGRHEDNWRAVSDATVACIVQIERASALEEVDAIAALADVDALFIGPGDLSNDLGCAADLDRDPLRSAALACVDAARAHGKAAGLYLAGTTSFDVWAMAGFSLLACSFETGLLRDASTIAARSLSQALAHG